MIELPYETVYKTVVPQSDGPAITIRLTIRCTFGNKRGNIHYSLTLSFTNSECPTEYIQSNVKGRLGTSEELIDNFILYCMQILEIEKHPMYNHIIEVNPIS